MHGIWTDDSTSPSWKEHPPEEALQGPCQSLSHVHLPSAFRQSFNATCPKAMQSWCPPAFFRHSFSSRKTVSIWVATKKSCSLISFPDFICFRLWQLGQASSGGDHMASPKQMGLGLVICHGDVIQKPWLRLNSDITAARHVGGSTLFPIRLLLEGSLKSKTHFTSQ